MFSFIIPHPSRVIDEECIKKVDSDVTLWFILKTQRKEVILLFTVKEVSKQTGVTVRTLHHYDAIGLLSPTEITESGYRLYDDSALARLHSILMLRELQFSLKDIKSILDNPNYDPIAAIEDQIKLLELQKQHIDELIQLAYKIQKEGIQTMNFKVFNNNHEQYKAEAKAKWGNTPAYKECEEKASSRTPDIGAQFSEVFVRIGAYKHMSPDAPEVQDLVRELQQFITDNFYHCTKETLSGLGEMYTADERFTANIDSAAGEGTAAFVSEAIRFYCK